MTSSAAEAVVLEGPRRLGRRSFVVPEVGPDDGLLQVEACGLCGTDHELWGGVLPGPYPFVPGHEIVGVVTAVGERAAARWGVAAGDRVAVEVFQSCRSCDACLRGDYRRCSVHGLADMYGLVAADRQPGLWGGYAEQLYLSPDAIVLPVPAGVAPGLVGYKELRIMGAFGVDGTAYRAALDLLATGRYPFADLPRRTAGLDGVGPLLATMAGEGAAGEPVPIHAVVVPG